MFSQSRSIKLSSVLLKLVFAGLIVSAFFLPRVIRFYYPVASMDPGLFALMCADTYLMLVIGLYAVARLHMLLDNIKKDIVFVPANTGHLRHLSYSCLAACVALFLFGFIKPTRPLAMLTGIVAFFLGLILRILRYVFGKAVELREENDAVI